ncbi:calcitonin-like [Pteropus medius]|uniref:calcitonin-like n=1 Tax=Pteropus vampyrus TaxID=132908 RepID=UPI00196B442D|nr:calcitonin-like [Pteropus giganteus]
MGFWKFSSFLVLGFLVLYQMGNLQAAPFNLDISRAERYGNLSTCVLGTYTQDLNKLRTFSQTAVGAGTPGKKGVMASGSIRDHDPRAGMTEDATKHVPHLSNFLSCFLPVTCCMWSSPVALWAAMSSFLWGSGCLEAQMGRKRAGPTCSKRIIQEEMREGLSSPECA